MSDHSKPSLKEINRLAIPAIVAGIAEPLIGLVDTAIIGRIGSTELAGAGIATSLFALLIWMLSQTKTAISSIVSKYLGMNREKELEPLIGQSILINLIVGALITAVSFTAGILLLKLYNASGEVLRFAWEYFSIRSLSFPFVLATYGLFGVYRGLQNTGWAMNITLIGGVLNLLLDLVLVFGIEGYIQPMGVKGAAIATVFAQVVMFILAVIVLRWKTPYRLTIRFPFHPELKNLLFLSGNLYIRTFSLNAAYFLAVRYATGYGEAHVAAHTIAMNIWLFSAFFIDGYASAANAISGKLAGQNEPETLYEFGRRIARISVGIAALLSLCYAGLFFFTGRFFTEDTAVIGLFESIYWLVILSQPINGIAFAYDGIFKGLGHGALLRNTLFFGTLCGFIPTLWILDSNGLGLYSVWVAFLFWMMIRASVLWWWFRKLYHRPA